MRNNYWTCSKFADWLRGTAKGGAKTSDGWNDWQKEAESKYPIRYWIAEEGLDILQNIVMFIPDKLYDIKYYINNRYITRTHCLTAHKSNIRPGEWCDVGYRFLPCLFNELVDFVEVELAWWHLAWNAEERPKYNMPWWAVGWWRVRTWRCPQAGLDNLEWQRGLTWGANELGEDNPNVGKRTEQAIRADEILALYKWWKEVYPNRPDPHEASGWTAYCRKKEALNEGRLFGGKTTPELEKLSNKALKLTQKIEQQYEREDTEMMIRLIKIRNSLWT